MDDVLERPSAEFESVAAPAPPQRNVTLSLDADLLDRLSERNLNAAEEINGLLRFYLDTTEAKTREFESDAWEPGEMQDAPTAS